MGMDENSYQAPESPGSDRTAPSVFRPFLRALLISALYGSALWILVIVGCTMFG
jgi:hypothetical protein